MGQPGFRPTPRVGDPSMSGLPPQLAGTGGVRSPAGPYGPPGFIGGGSVPVSGAQPLNPGSGTTYGVGTTMYANGAQTGGLEPAPYGGMGSPAPTNGPRLPPIPPGTPEFFADNWAAANGYPWNANNPKPGTPEWFQSAQGLNAQKEMAMRIANGVLPGVMNGGRFAGGGGRFDAMHANRPDPRTNAGEGYVSPVQQLREASQNGPGTFAQNRAAAIEASKANTWGNPDWRMQQVLAGKIAPTNNAELQAMLANMSPADRDAYIAKYKSIGLDPTYQGGGGTGPFGN